MILFASYPVIQSFLLLITKREKNKTDAQPKFDELLREVVRCLNCSETTRLSCLCTPRRSYPAA